MSRQIVVSGGAGYWCGPEGSKLDEYALSLTGRPRPRICALCTASGDAEHYIRGFYGVSGQGSNWNTDTALITLTVMVRSDGLSPVEVTGFEFDQRWGTVISATTPEKRPLPVTISRDELAGFIVTVQASGRGCSPPSSLAPQDRPSSLLTMRTSASWFPLAHSVTLPGIDSVADTALTSICTGDF